MTLCGGYVAHVEQHAYGHPAKKATWLYTYGIPPRDLPRLVWRGRRSEANATMGVSWCRNRSTDVRPRVGKDLASRTPLPFRDLLLGIARAVTTTGSGAPTS